MALTDPIAQALTQIRNAILVKKTTVDIPASKLLGGILEILKREDYIDNFKLLKDTKQGTLRTYLKYDKDGKPAIINLKKVSRPGLKLYVKSDKIPRVLRGLGMAIISTSQGLMTDKQARGKKIGGEVLLFVW